MKRLSKEEIVELIEKITDCENQSEEEIDRLTERLQQGVLDSANSRLYILDRDAA